MEQAWRAGQIDAGKVQVVVEEVTALADVEVMGGVSRAEIDELSDELVGAAARYATTHTPTETRTWLRRRIIALAPEVAELRRGRAEHERRVQITPADDGMGQLWALLPGVQARQIQQALTSAAHQCGTHDPRTMDQRRADLLIDWLLGPDHAPTVHLHLVTEPTGEPDPTPPGQLDTVLDTAAWLPGLGPLTELQTADLLLTATTITRTATGTATVGCSGTVGITEPGYRPSTTLDQTIRTRDVTCRFPGCRRSALDTGTDLDHTIPWPTGPTGPTNLIHS